jgi:hypothetical protein
MMGSGTGASACTFSSQNHPIAIEYAFGLVYGAICKGLAKLERIREAKQYEWSDCDLRCNNCGYLPKMQLISSAFNEKNTPATTKWVRLMMTNPGLNAIQEF